MLSLQSLYVQLDSLSMPRSDCHRTLAVKCIVVSLNRNSAQRLTGHFWKRWHAEYLPKWTVRRKWMHKYLRYRKVVLTYEDNVKMNNRPLGMVTEVNDGADGVIRTVTLKKQKGTLNRSIPKLHWLEGHKEHMNDEILKEKTYSPETVTNPKPTKSLMWYVKAGKTLKNLKWDSETQQTPSSLCALRQFISLPVVNVFPCALAVCIFVSSLTS